MAEGPLTRLLATLVAERRCGADFEEAWPAAMREALAGVGGAERSNWTAALNGTMRAWEASYERFPQSSRESAAGLLSEGRGPAPVDGDSCAHCGQGVVQPGRGARRLYCSARCRRDAYEHRRLAAA
jgi:hypothetical protein